MAAPKRKVIEIINLEDDDDIRLAPLARPARPRRLRRPRPTNNLVSQAPGGLVRLQGTTIPPTACPPPKSWRPQHQHHQPSALLDARFYPTPGPTVPVGLWQTGPPALLHSFPNFTPAHPGPAISHSVSNPTTPTRDVCLTVGGYQDVPSWNAHLAGPSSFPPVVANFSALSMLGQGGAHPGPARYPVPHPANMIPANRLTPANGTPVYGLPEVSSERAPAHVGRRPDQAQTFSIPSGRARRPVVAPSTPSSYHDATTPASGSGNFSVVIKSAPRPQIPKHMIFDLTASDEESTPKTSNKSPSRLQRPKGAPARKVHSGPALVPKQNGLAPGKPNLVQAAESGPKKRGRPFKDPEASGKDKAPKKRHVPFPVPGDFHSEIPLPKPIYNPFVCEWEGCPAKLHNLEALRHHVFHVHNKKLPSGVRACLWGKCIPAHGGLNSENKAPGVLDTGVKFETKAAWQEHISKSHLLPVAWQLGDGPKATPLGRFTRSSTILYLLEDL